MRMLFEWVPEGRLTSGDARQLLAPYIQQLRTIWCDSWKAWLAEISQDVRSRLTNRSRSTCLNDFAVDRAKELFVGIDGVESCPLLGFFKLYVGNKAVLRFKRLNRDKLAMNVKTEQQLAYYRDEPLAGIRPECTRLNIGYQLNHAETDVEDIFVTYQLGRRSVRWSFSIMDDAELVQMPVPVGPAPIPAPILIQPKTRTPKASDGI